MPPTSPSFYLMAKDDIPVCHLFIAISKTEFSALKFFRIPAMVSDVGIPETEQHITVEEYLDGEKESEVRHEYIGGLVYAMSGGSEAHNTICLNLASAIRQHLRGNPCKVFMADMKLRLNIAEDAVFYYPDLLVTCDPSDNEPYFKTKPVVLVEVLSPSTERLDRREKFLSYIALPTLKEYVMIDQARQAVTRFRQENGWKPEHLAEGDALSLPSISFEQSLAGIYEDVDLAEHR